VRTLHLTEPYLSGPDVLALQHLLADNRYGSFFRGEFDGQYGPYTAQRAAASKWHLGYAVKNIAPTAGPQLISLLGGQAALTPAMLQRREARIAAAREHRANPAKALRLRALEIARRDVGIVEGYGNDIKYNEWWCDGDNDGAPYCVRAGSYWYAHAGSKVIVRGSRYQGTDVLLYDAQHERNGVVLDPDPDPGCGFVIDFDGHIDPDHFGLYVSDAGHGLFNSLEANATLSTGKQGVGYHVRPYAQCWFIVFRS
jgi:hypothetical protein